MKLSEKIKNMATSPTLAIDKKAKEMKQSGVDVINFGVGEPDFDTPGFIVDAAKSALDEGYTRYSPVAGIAELKEAISNYIFRGCDVRYSPDQTISTCGAKSALFMAFQVLLNPGDKVVIPAPYWVSYPDQVRLAGGTPKIVKTKEENSFKITPDELKEASSNGPKILLINSPSNPTGAVYTRDELNKIVDICISKEITIVTDEIYDQLVFDGEFCSVISAHPSAAEHTIYINGVSKGYAMTGWRMGYAAGPKDVIAAMTKYQGQLLTCIPPFVQKAAAVALSSPPDATRDMFEQLKDRRGLILSLLDTIPGISYIKPQGAFYVFINIKNYLGKTCTKGPIATCQDMAGFLLDNAHVATVPGEAFGTGGYLRLSFATSTDEIKKGVKRIAETLKQLT